MFICLYSCLSNRWDKRVFVLLVSTKLLLSLPNGTAVQQLHTPCFVSIDQLIALMPAALLTRPTDIQYTVDSEVGKEEDKEGDGETPEA